MVLPRSLMYISVIMINIMRKELSSMMKDIKNNQQMSNVERLEALSKAEMFFIVLF